MFNEEGLWVDTLPKRVTEMPFVQHSPEKPFVQPELVQPEPANSLLEPVQHSPAEPEMPVTAEPEMLVLEMHSPEMPDGKHEYFPQYH